MVESTSLLMFEREHGLEPSTSTLAKGFRALISLANLSKDKDMPLQGVSGRPTSSRSGGDESGDANRRRACPRAGNVPTRRAPGSRAVEGRVRSEEPAAATLRPYATRRSAMSHLPAEPLARAQRAQEGTHLKKGP
jgi:hypothetical protein